jgi:hypothetical protein
MDTIDGQPGEPEGGASWLFHDGSEQTPQAQRLLRQAVALRT